MRRVIIITLFFLGYQFAVGQQTCSDGDFEGSLSAYTFRYGIPDPRGLNLDVSDLLPETISPTLNDLSCTSGHFTLVDNSGFDTTTIPGLSLDRTAGGSGHAIRVNCSGGDERNAAMVSRQLTINGDFLNFQYSLVLKNVGPAAPLSSFHEEQQRPMFNVLIKDNLGFVLKRMDVLLEDDNCRFFSYPMGSDDWAYYTGWTCGSIDTNDLIGQTVTVEFIIQDCSGGSHFGVAYLDNICSSSCPAPAMGTINFDQMDQITCPTEGVQICGTFTSPANSTMQDITLQILHNSNVVSQYVSTSANISGNRFCFDIPLSFFQTNAGLHNFEFHVLGHFTLNGCAGGGTSDLTIVGDSTYDGGNNNGYDVFINNCIDAVNDAESFISCQGGSLHVLDNDKEDAADANISNVIMTQVSGNTTQLLLNTTSGIVTVPPGAPPGDYILKYRICRAVQPDTCDTAIVTVHISANPILAVDDNYSATPFISCAGGSTPSVLANDQICGGAVTSSQVVCTLLTNGGITGATISGSGIITIPPSTLPGTYTLTYRICETTNNTNCATASVTVSVNAAAAATFSLPASICMNTPLTLPTTSNGISGTWSPAQVDMQVSGDYVFHPSDSCIPDTVYHLEVVPCLPILSWDSDIGCEESVDDIKPDQNIQSSRCIRVCKNNVVNYQLVGSGNSLIANTEWHVEGGTILSSTNTNCEVTWDGTNGGLLYGTIYYSTGSQATIHRCIEKKESPTALFTTAPDPVDTDHYVCHYTPVYFENLSSAGSGNEVLYYNWDFGDGNTSSEFEPSHVFPASAEYLVTLTVFNGCSCQAVYTSIVHVTKAANTINCESVVCENDIAMYGIDSPPECTMQWTAVGGTVVSSDAGTASVLWDGVDDDGFGYISVSGECTSCASVVKIPVVKSVGTIKGDATVCANSQAIYSLPQWPSTDFQWSLASTTSGTSLITNTQRNQIVLDAGVSGTVVLNCDYTNTLIGCRGHATITITIKKQLRFKGPSTRCAGSTANYDVVDESQVIQSGIAWAVQGPNGFSQSGTTCPFSIVYPSPGSYLITMPANGCSEEFHVDVSPPPSNPGSITGPDPVCPGQLVSYSCPPVADAEPFWTITNGTIIGSKSGLTVDVVFNPNATTPFTLSVQYKGLLCSSAIYTKTIPRYTPNMNLSTYDQQVCASSRGHYTVSETTGETYAWQLNPPASGSIESGQNSPSITVLWNSSSGTKQIILTVRKCGTETTQIYPVTVLSPPVASITAPLESCSGNVSFSASLAGGGTGSNVVWNFDDNTPPVTGNYGQNMVHNFSSMPGQTAYTVSAEILDPKRMSYFGNGHTYHHYFPDTRHRRNTEIDDQPVPYHGSRRFQIFCRQSAIRVWCYQ
ncbi:PKD domain-containing protein [Flavobacterium sp. N1718]|uniref:PKD domain-containing protein n=1 Tax=Flavobacterium sp. N1718 TaxID=2986822 RepID=UPI002225AB84|nr:PKD domain-containing protein [Flavobacterium sp. N1718]